MHIALVSTYYYPRLRGGTEHSLQHLAESLSRRGVKVSVLSLHEGKKPERFKHNEVECHVLPAPHLSQCLDLSHRSSTPARVLWHMLDVFNPSACRLLENELTELKPDLVQTHNLPGWSCAAWTAVRSIGLPHVQVLHDYQLTCPPATRFRNGENCKETCAQCMPFCAFRRKLSKRVKHIVANSSYTRQIHLDLGFFRSAQSFDVIYGAVPPGEPQKGSTQVRDQLRIGYLGRLHPAKGLEGLIDSFISANRSDAVLRIAGSGDSPYEFELRQRAKGRAIEFLGQTSGPTFLSSLDVLVVPSLWNEPMGRVIIEAATHGVPVVAAARGGIPELVKVGRTGWLFDPSIPGQLSKILRHLNIQELKKLAPDCLTWGQFFDPKAISSQWISLYERLLGRTERAAGIVPTETSHFATRTSF
jgi:glycogen(starch) synthase